MLKRNKLFTNPILYFYINESSRASIIYREVRLVFVLQAERAISHHRHSTLQHTHTHTHTHTQNHPPDPPNGQYQVLLHTYIHDRAKAEGYI
jgi:hypothetical protein